MAKVNLKNIYSSENQYTVLQLIKTLIEDIEAIDYVDVDDYADDKQAILNRLTALEEQVETNKGDITTIVDTLTNVISDVTSLKLFKNSYQVIDIVGISAISSSQLEKLIANPERTILKAYGELFRLIAINTSPDNYVFSQIPLMYQTSSYCTISINAYKITKSSGAIEQISSEEITLYNKTQTDALLNSKLPIITDGDTKVQDLPIPCVYYDGTLNFINIRTNNLISGYELTDDSYLYTIVNNSLQPNETISHAIENADFGNVYTGTPEDDEQIANKKYVDDNEWHVHTFVKIY